MKTRSSKLDAHAEQLREWDGLSIPLAEMASRLKALGCSVSLSRLSSFLEAQRSAALQARLLGQITTGSRACKEVEARFKKDAPPELETLINLHRLMVLQMSTAGMADPKLIQIADQGMRTVMEFVSGQTKARLEERKLALQERRVELLERKEALADAAERVTKSDLSPEEKQLKMKEIFGLA